MKGLKLVFLHGMSFLKKSTERIQMKKWIILWIMWIIILLKGVRQYLQRFQLP